MSGADFTPTNDQNKVIEALVKEIIDCQTIAKTKLASEGSQGRYPADWLKFPRHIQTFGLFGPRGSGKTTILLEIKRKLAETAGIFVCPQVADGSLWQADVPVGLSLLTTIKDALDGRHGERVPPQKAEAQQKFNTAESAYMESVSDYRQLAARLAVSRQEYGKIAADGIRARNNLAHKIARWLEIESKLHSFDVAVVFLDDADLMASGLGARLIWSILDELHQPRLVLVLAGDLNRLEAQMTDVPNPTGREATSQTALQLFYKALPSRARFRLKPWSLEERKSFSRDNQRLDALLKDRLIDPALTELLPRWPRGLENIHHYLRHTPDGSDYFTYLAEARGEDRLANYLRERTLAADSWLLESSPTSSPLNQQGWTQIATNLADPAAYFPLTTLGFELTNLGIAEGADSTLWIEALLPEPLPPKIVTHLLFEQPILRQRFSQAQISLEIPEAAISVWLETAGEYLANDLLHLDWETPLKGPLFRVRAGWRPFVEAAAHRRGFLPEELFRYFYHWPTIEPSSPEFGALPGTFRSLVAFAAFIDAAPWRDLTQRGWSWKPSELAWAARGCTLATYRAALGGQSAPLAGPKGARDWALRLTENLPAAEDIRWRMDLLRAAETYRETFPR